MADNLRKCTDCGSDRLTEIELISRSHGRISNLEYALANSKVSFWTGHRPIAGTVTAYRCEVCGLLKLYGATKGL